RRSRARHLQSREPRIRAGGERGCATGAWQYLAGVESRLHAQPDTLARLLDVLHAHADAGVVGAVVCDADGAPDPASRRRDPLLLRSWNEMTGRAKREL